MTSNTARLVRLLEALMATEPPAQVAPERLGETLFLSVSDGKGRARTAHASGPCLADACRGLPDIECLWPGVDGASAWIRMDRVTHVVQVTWRQARQLLHGTKTNYFSLGISWDEDLRHAILPEELWANACLYTGDIDHCTPHAENLRALTARRFGKPLDWPTADDVPVWLFATAGVFAQGDQAIQRLDDDGVLNRMRHLPRLDGPTVEQAVRNGADYLAHQVTETGQWTYGRYPCFDRPVPSYNVLRHATAAYALLEAWEMTRRPEHLAAATRAIDHLCEHFIRPVIPSPAGRPRLYLVEVDGDIKLGGNGVAIVVLAKLAELTGDLSRVDLMRTLAEGLLALQQEDGSFVHVVSYPSLALKERFRTIYYDGEALFGLMRAYAFTRDERLLDAARRAADHFERAGHWKAHDHWLAYGLAELTRHCPDTRYLRLALQNVGRHVDFIRDRITAYPTLLELCMASRQITDRMHALGQIPALVSADYDPQAVEQALHARARRLFSAYLFPELAMFFRSPGAVSGTFCIRHFSFRIRIDDVQHFLSGLVAYHRAFLARESTQDRAPGSPRSQQAAHC